MDATTGRAYDDFVPPHNMVAEPATHTLTVDLSAAGYKKKHIRVQLLRSHGLVVVRGERAVAGNRWSRFRLEFRVPDGCDVKGIHAKFEGGVVGVTMPGIKTGPASGRGYCYLSERRKLVTTVVAALLVLFSLGIYVRYSFGP